MDSPHQYYIFAEVFKDEVCAGYDSNAIGKALADRGHLLTKEPQRYSYKKTIPGLGRVRVYHILPSLFDDNESDQAEDEKEFGVASRMLG